MARRAPWSRTLGVLLLATSFGACASTYSDLRYEPAMREMELRGEAADLQARALVAWRGVEERDELLALRFRVRVENPGPTLFVLVPAQFELIDAALNSFGFADNASVPASVAPGSSVTFDLAFPVLGPHGLDAFDFAVLTLHSRLQGERWSWSSTFPRAVEPDHASGPSFGFSIGWLIGS